VRGATNAEIGRGLGLNEKTVRNYLTAVFEKLGVDSRVQAALRARDAGIEG
jgi:DNA-binding NarL/FixJ family response regulator